MSRSEATVEELLQLLPAVDELEVLRLRLIGSAVPDPEKEWDSSSAYITVDKRILGMEEVERSLTLAEQALRDYVSYLHEGLRPVFRSYFAGAGDEAAQHLIHLGERLENSGRAASARQCYRTALDVSLPLTEKAPQILALRRIARVALSLGEFHDATLHYTRSADLARDSGDVRAEVVSRTGVGNVLMFQGRWGEAETCYADALATLDGLDEREESLERGQLYNNLGNVTTRRDRYDEAEEWLARARDLWDRVRSPVDLAVWRLNLANLRGKQGRYAEAREVCSKAMELPVPPALLTLVASDMAEHCVTDGHVGEAEEWGRVAEEHAIAAGSPYNLGHMYHVRGNVAAARGDEDGFTFFEKALEIAREKGYPFLEAETLLDYAGLRRQSGGAEEAAAYLERARELFLSLGSVQDLAQAERALAEIRAAREPAADLEEPLAAAGD